MSLIQLETLTHDLQQWSAQLGFQQVGISDTDLSLAENYLFSWLKHGYHGDMHWMASHGQKRSRPQELLPGTLRVISVRMDYWLDHNDSAWAVIHDSHKAFISRYALGRDYHKIIRQRLQSLANKITASIGAFGYRVFVDSAPVMEKPLAQKAGLGWVGKHTNLINRQAGSYFFLGEIYTDLPLPITTTISDDHCGTCQACIDACPTGAIIAPYELDARRCISYLTIEHHGAIPIEYRQLLGNRIYGCDDCQLVCPWNRFAQQSQETDFAPRQQLDDISLIELFDWDETTFLRNTEGSAIRRIGHERWLRNIAVGLGNAQRTDEVVKALLRRKDHASELVREHVYWALQQHGITP